MNKRIELQKIEALASEVIQPKSKNIFVSFFTYSGKNIYIIKYDSISTTMLPSQKWNRDIVNDQNIFVFQAEEQTHGRGQNNNNWASPTGNLYITILCKTTSDTCSKLSLITAAAMVSTCRKELHFSHEVNIKWMNDIFLQNRKVGGCIVITEFYQSKFTSQIAPLEDSICLKEVKKESINISIFTRNFLQIFIDSLKKPVNSFSLYRQSLKFINQNVNIFDNTLNNILYSGIFKGITDFGHAILEIEDKQQALSQGRMRLKETHPIKSFLFKGLFQNEEGEIIQINQINEITCQFSGNYRPGAKKLISQETIGIKGIFHYVGSQIIMSWSTIAVEQNFSILSWTGVYVEQIIQLQSGINCSCNKKQISISKNGFIPQLPIINIGYSFFKKIVK